MAKKISSGGDAEHTHKGVRVGESFAGRGVYATRAFKTGELIGRVRGTVHDDPDYGSSYAIDMGENFTLEPAPPFRFLNHCCVPNASLYTLEQPVRGKVQKRVVVEALADIRDGEEITIDYAWTAKVAIPCLCGHAQCRGYVVSIDELPLIKADKTRKPTKPSGAT